MVFVYIVVGLDVMIDSAYHDFLQYFASDTEKADWAVFRYFVVVFFSRFYYRD